MVPHRALRHREAPIRRGEGAVPGPPTPRPRRVPWPGPATARSRAPADPSVRLPRQVAHLHRLHYAAAEHERPELGARGPTMPARHLPRLPVPLRRDPQPQPL